MKQILFFFCIISLSLSAKVCRGRIYYKPNCNLNTVEYIGFTNEACQKTRHGLESMGLITKVEKYLDICGNQQVSYCVKVDENNNVFYTSAVGYRPNATCDSKSYKFISNLCDCPSDLNSKCVNTQKFKIADCYVISGTSHMLIIGLLVLFCLLL